MNLTDTQVKSALSTFKKQSIKTLVKLADGKGLFFIIDKSGYAYWRLDYSRPVSKKRNSISLGTYPEVSLASARIKRNEYRDMLAQNIDPALKRQAQEEMAQFQNNSFKSIADEYRKTEELEPSTQRRNQFVWDKLYAAIGEYPIDVITPSQILEVCRLYERQGKNDSAKRMRSKASQVFRYAIALGFC